MRFSFSLIKKLVPRLPAGRHGLKSKKELVEKLNIHSFEAVDLAGDVFDAVIPPNRYSDASHIGIAKEISAILGMKTSEIGKARNRLKLFSSESRRLPFRVKVEDKNLCPRYAAGYFENVKIAQSPKWLRKILIDCGLRPINNVVDVMNYVMLEVGQPLHAFDYDKISNSEIIIRRAEKGEKITSLDNKVFELNENILVIAGDKEPLAIAGVKGGKKAEVDKNTKKIIVESANFDSSFIYKASKNLKLTSDASTRFSRDLSPELAEIGLRRATELLETVCGAKAGGAIDVYPKKLPKKIVKFDVEKFNKFIGTDFDVKTCREYLERLGFKITNYPVEKQLPKGSSPITQLLVEAPLSRLDIETFEDLAEEIVRLYGYNRLKTAPPRVHLIPSGFEDAGRLWEKIKKILTAFGLSETQNYSLIGECRGGGCFELENPLSEERRYLRNTLAPLLLSNIKDNTRFFEEVKIFEIGKVFFGRERREVLELGVALASKNKENFFELKGMVNELFKKIGLVDYLFVPEGKILKIESGGENIGYLEKEAGAGIFSVSLAEIDLEKLLTLVVGEHEYAPLPKYPSAMRDVSAAFEEGVRIGDVVQAIQQSDLKHIEDVDLIDEYQNNLTFRIVFQASDRTLTDEEINQKLKKISGLLKNKFGAIIR